MSPAMKPGRQSRLITVIISLCMMLFAQGVLAGYFCQEEGSPAQMAAITGGPECATAMQTNDQEDRVLCHSHCQSGSQTSDNYQPPAPPDAGELTAGALTVRLPAVGHFEPNGSQQTILQRSSTPSIALQHCCFRI